MTEPTGQNVPMRTLNHTAKYYICRLAGVVTTLSSHLSSQVDLHLLGATEGGELRRRSSVTNLYIGNKWPRLENIFDSCRIMQTYIWRNECNYQPNVMLALSGINGFLKHLK